MPDFSGTSVASDAEETMTPPFPRPGAPTPDAHQPTPPPVQDPSPQNATDGAAPDDGHTTPPSNGFSASASGPSDPGHSGGPYSTTPPPVFPDAASGPAGSNAPYTTPTPGFAGAAGQTPPQEPPVPEAERTVTDEPNFAPGDLPEAERTVADGVPPSAPEAEAGADSADGRRTLAVLKIPTNGGTTTAPGPELEPDAILPPGTPPQAPPEPPQDPHATTTGPIPRLGSGASFPGPPGGHPPQGGGAGGASGARRALLVAGGLVAALVLGGGGALAVTQLSGGSAKEHKVADSQPPPAPTQVRPTPTPSKTKAKRKPKHVPVDIRDEKTDPKPLTVGEVFPSTTLTLASEKFARAKAVINDHCSLAANGPFATELTRQHCRRVVRATFVSSDKKVAVTTGIAVMPTDAAAKAVLKVQDPAHYEWFRGMKASGAPKIDHAGGFAASTVRGRYISYAYATYVDGHKPAADDDTLKKVGTAFRDSTARPIERREDKH